MIGLYVFLTFPPGNDLIDQTTDDFSGTYLHAPMVVLNFGESASLGTDTRQVCVL